MLAAPLNDVDCLTRLTAVAKEGLARPDLRALAARFPTTDALAAWIRALPQRDDTGDDTDGPRVACDVSQRARLLADDPNCVERAILYIAAAELIDPGPTRQLATVELSRTVRHTFPIEDGEPVVLDPDVRRNALRAAIWRARNGESGGPGLGGPVDLAPIARWLFELAAIEADERDGATGVARVERGWRALQRLGRGGPVTLAERGDVLYALRRAGEAAPAFGEMSAEAYEVARVVVARALTRPAARRGAVRVDPARAVYWGGKALATYYGVGGLYDAAYAEVRRATAGPKRRPRPRPAAPPPSAPAPPPPAQVEVPSARPSPAPPSPVTASPPPVAAGAPDELETKGLVEP